jgi:AcrR family transcriptional regulator
MRGPAAVREALIEATATLYAANGTPSVRAIARAAGVNHGLVHHYFPDKGALLQATLSELANRQAVAMGDLGGMEPGALVQRAWSAQQQDPRLVRILARQMLDGTAPDELQERFPVVALLVHNFERAGVDDARTLVAEGLSLALGMLVFGPWVSAATGLPAERLGLTSLMRQLERNTQGPSQK